VTDQVDHRPGRTGEIAGFHEVAIITGTARRRRFSPEEKMRVVAESLDPALSVSAVAARHGINPNQLFAWRKRLREEVRKAGEPVAAASAESGGPSPDSDLIEIVCEGATIRVRSGVDGAALGRVLTALRGVR
jgi:transposase